MKPQVALVLVFHPTDRRATRDAEDEWTGTMIVDTWTDDLVVLDLVDGTHCMPGATGVTCVPSEGTFSVLGVRGPAEVAAARMDWEPGMHDLASGLPLCRPEER